MSQFKFGDFEIDVDVTDVAFVEKYETATESYEREINNISNGSKASEMMKAMCEVFFNIFNGLFGEGTSTKMFGDRLSVDLCVQAFKQFIEVMNDYSTTLESMKIIVPNRVQRRTKK